MAPSNRQPFRKASERMSRNGQGGIPEIGGQQEGAPIQVAQPINDLQLLCLMTTHLHATAPNVDGEGQPERIDRLARESMDVLASVVVQHKIGEQAKAAVKAQRRLLDDPREKDDHKIGKTDA
ncbi:MAG TPA: hypothetical protein PK308_00045 [Phycisphaerales bacterium]|nr:hypothetical protein [Phycisphaerales bacterium]